MSKPHNPFTSAYFNSNRIGAGSNEMRIVQVNTLDQAGGAERIASQLLRGYEAAGHETRLMVGKKVGDDPRVIELDRIAPRGWMARVRRWLAMRWHRELGREFFDWPGTGALLNTKPFPDVLQLHNLHGLKMGYFDLRLLPSLSRRLPVVLTLHDAWLLAGHCAHSFDCDRWKTGCGRCPDLRIPPAVKRDGTAWNWEQKRAIYSQSRLCVATPSRWLMQKVEQSILAPAVAEARVIPNGVDLSVFCPGDRRKARESLGLPLDARIVLFVANRIQRNRWKDFATLRKAVEIVAHRWQGEPLLFMALGEDSPEEQIGAAKIRFIPYEDSPGRVAAYYQAADLYVHAAKADTFPTVVLEALACGCPVVATAVGGIPEQIEDGISGWLVPPRAAESMAGHICHVLGNSGVRLEASVAAVTRARRLYGLDRQVQSYLAWFDKICGVSSVPEGGSQRALT